MKALENTNCCSAEKEGLRSNLNLGANGRSLTVKYLFICIPLLAAWWAIYLYLSPIADFATGGLLRLLKLPEAGHLGSAIAFFIYEVPKVLLLLTLVVVPTVYVLIAKNTHSPEYISQLIDKLAASAKSRQAAET